MQQVGHVEIEAVSEHHDIESVSMQCTWKRCLFPSVSFDSVDSNTQPLMFFDRGILCAAAPRCGSSDGPGGDLRTLPRLVDGLGDSCHRGGCLAVKSTPPGRGGQCFLACHAFCGRKEGPVTPNTCGTRNRSKL